MLAGTTIYAMTYDPIAKILLKRACVSVRAGRYHICSNEIYDL